MEQRKRVVVVDDNEVFATMVEDALSFDYEIHKGKDGREGVELCARWRPQLLIADVGMPRMDGVAMLKELKKNPVTASIPVIILTATHFNTTSRRSFETDPQVRSIMFKPCSVETLTATVSSILGPPAV